MHLIVEANYSAQKNLWLVIWSYFIAKGDTFQSKKIFRVPTI